MADLYQSRHTGAVIDDAVDRAKAGGELDKAIEGRIDSQEKGAVDGVATLDGDGKVPTEQVDAYSKSDSISAATRTALSLAETATPDAALAEIARQLSESKGVQMDILWENPSPKSTFPAQTISFRANDYTHFAVIFKNVINLTSPLFLVQPGDIANCGVIGSNGGFQQGVTVLFTRYITEITQTSMTFTDAKTESNGTWQSYNNNIIPVYIYGVIGVPTA